MNNERDWPEFLRDLKDYVSEQLMTLEVGGQTADHLATQVVNKVRENWGGMSLYLPKGDCIDITDRDKALWSMFDGRNHKQLAEHFGLSVNHVYARLRHCRHAIKADEA